MGGEVLSLEDLAQQGDPVADKEGNTLYFCTYDRRCKNKVPLLTFVWGVWG